jgi:hypothetical protein
VLQLQTQALATNQPPRRQAQATLQPVLPSTANPSSSCFNRKPKPFVFQQKTKREHKEKREHREMREKKLDEMRLRKKNRQYILGGPWFRKSFFNWIQNIYKVYSNFL